MDIQVGILAHRTSEDDGLGCPNTETKRFWYLGSMKPFSEGDWIPRDAYIIISRMPVNLEEEKLK